MAKLEERRGRSESPAGAKTGDTVASAVSLSPTRNGDATDQLRSLILGGRLMPNQRLVEADLVTMLGSSRSHVRSALARLEQEGLVVSAPNRGAWVRLVTGEEAIEITQARGALEGLIVRQAALNVTKADTAQLKRIERKMRDALEAGDLLGYSEFNGQLHAELYRIAKLPIVARLLLNLKSQTVRYQYRPILLPGRPPASILEHTEIVDAVCAADPDWAERAMRKHIDEVLAALRQIITDREAGAL